MKKFNTKDSKFYWDCTLRKSSEINIVGKIVLFPVIVIVVVTWMVMDFLFLKDNGG